MVDTTSTTPSDDEFYDEATETFPRKEDFEDRLVAIWVTGKHGTRISEANNKPYGWVETVTMALDDGQDGTKGLGNASDGDPFLVGPAPAVAEPFQWSAEGMYSRLYPRIKLVDGEGQPDYRPVIGRINRRKNAKKGFNDSWSIGKPTDDDKAFIRENHLERLASTTARVKKDREEAQDSEAFDD